MCYWTTLYSENITNDQRRSGDVGYINQGGEEGSREVTDEEIQILDWKLPENRLIFTKIREIDLGRFHRFSENWPVKFETFKILKETILKKTRVYFKIFGQNRIKKFEVARYSKFCEV
jgi:hypothetical protein